GDAVGEYGDLKIVLAGAMGHADFMVMGALHFRREVEQADPRIRFAEISGCGIEAFFGAKVRPGSRVSVFDNRIGREMKIGGSVGTERVYESQELNRLQFAAEFKLQYVADREIIGGGER